MEFCWPPICEAAQVIWSPSEVVHEAGISFGGGLDLHVQPGTLQRPANTRNMTLRSTSRRE
jgi:hypothetical protein